MPPIRVLQIMPAMDAGGMETFVMNVYRAVDRSQVQFDFLYHYDKPCFYDAEIEALGGHITKLSTQGGAGGGIVEGEHIGHNAVGQHGERVFAVQHLPGALAAGRRNSVWPCGPFL